MPSQWIEAGPKILVKGDGDKLRVSIIGRNDEGYYLLSKLKVQRPKDWAGLEKAFQEKRAIAGVVSGVASEPWLSTSASVGSPASAVDPA